VGDVLGKEIAARYLEIASALLLAALEDDSITHVPDIFHVPRMSGVPELLGDIV
jgi:hypothetical protein